MDQKTFDDNFALKLVIDKALITIIWGFLLHVLKKFGFCQFFPQWIGSTISLTYLSMIVNGAQHDYFDCTMGVRHGDPPFPFLEISLLRIFLT